MFDKILTYTFDGEDFEYNPTDDEKFQQVGRDAVKKAFGLDITIEEDQAALLVKIMHRDPAIETFYQYVCDAFKDEAYQAFLNRKIDDNHRC